MLLICMSAISPCWRMKLILSSFFLLYFMIAPVLLTPLAVLQVFLFTQWTIRPFPLPSHFTPAPIQDAESCIQHLKTPGMTNIVSRICRTFVCCGTSVPHSFVWNLQRPPFHHNTKEKKFWNALKEPEKCTNLLWY